MNLIKTTPVVLEVRIVAESIEELTREMRRLALMVQIRDSTRPMASAENSGSVSYQLKLSKLSKQRKEKSHG